MTLSTLTEAELRAISFRADSLYYRARACVGGTTRKAKRMAGMSVTYCKVAMRVSAELSRRKLSTLVPPVERFQVWVKTPDMERPVEGHAIHRMKTQADEIAARMVEQAKRSGWNLTYFVKEV